MPLNPDKLRQRLEPLFQENFDRFGELGAAVAIWQEGAPIVEMYGGFRDAHREHRWTADTLVLVWSATKGVGSACLLHALQQNGLEPGQRVAEFWPEFGQNGKVDITIRQMMAHAAGLCALDRSVDVLDYEAVIRALEEQAPLWRAGAAHGYHARTFGFLLDELVRRITGLTISHYWRKFLAEPLGLDFWIGLPKELNNRVATMYAAKSGGSPEPAKFYRDLTTRGTLQRRTFTSPHGLHAVSAMNNPEVRAHPIVSFGGIGSASALAKFYGMLANDGMMEGRRYFEMKTLQWIATEAHFGIDRVFEIPTGFSCGFMVDPQNAPRSAFGANGATRFGHPGAGGSLAFADSAARIGFAYIMNQMEQSVLPTEKSLRLVDLLRDQR